MPAPALQWKTKVNATAKTGLKAATTHFGVEYTLIKDGTAGNWSARVTASPLFGRHGGTETLASGVGYARAKKAAQDDYAAHGGR